MGTPCVVPGRARKRFDRIARLTWGDAGCARMSTNENSSNELLSELVRSGEVTGSVRGGRDRSAREDFSFAALIGADAEFLVLDLDGSIVEANVSACDQLGYLRDELVGLPVSEISTRQTRSGFAKLITTIDREGTQFLFGHNRRKDGSTYPVEARLWIADRDDAPHVFCLLSDASGYQGLIEERDQLISLIENSAEAIAVASPAGICNYMNPTGREMLGIADGDLTGRPLADLCPPELRERVESEVLPAMQRGRWQGELAFVKAGGGTFPCWVNGFAIRHSQSGEVIGLAVIAHDISERKAVERHREKLLSLNELSRNVATSLLEHDDLNKAVGIILAGLGGIFNVSRSYLCRYREDRSWVFRTHQWTAEGAEIHLVEPRPESARIYAWATEILVRGMPIRIDDVPASGIVPTEGSGVLRPDVKALLVMPVLIGGRLESFFGFVDTTGVRRWDDEELAILQIIVDSFSRAVERRIAERARQAIAVDLEKSVARERAANRYKSEFLANMSHELRTPMNSIVGYAELLSRPNVDKPKHDAWVGHIRQSTNYLLSLINDVLDLSKIEAGQMTVSKERCSLPEIVSNVRELLSGQASERLLEYRFVYEGRVPEWIETDPVRLQQILVNLVGNAIKFTRKGSVTVRIRTRADANASKEQLQFEVIDTGIGIEAGALSRLFRPFSQVHATGDARFGGTGLGLDISRHLARLLGGEIEVESEVGKGSTFTLWLRLDRAEPAGVPTGSPHDRTADHIGPRAFAERRFLIVDDSAENVEVLRFLITESGGDADAADNGARGVEMALGAVKGGRPYDAILMDMNMPVLDGYSATRRLVESGCKTPVIALTALALAGDEQRCLDAGCVDYISKPVVPSRFFQTIWRNLWPRSTAVVAERDDTTSDDADELPLSLAGNPRFQPLVDRYVASFRGLIVEFREHFAVERFERLRTGAHRLRGTAANYGYPAISKAAGKCEDAMRNGAPSSEIGQRLDELCALMQSALPDRT